MNAIDLKAPYSRNSFLSFFRDHFLPEDFTILDERIDPGFESAYFKGVSKIGEIPSLDLTIYEIKHHSENDPRVSLSRDSFRLLSQYGQQRALSYLFLKKGTCLCVNARRQATLRQAPEEIKIVERETE